MHLATRLKLDLNLMTITNLNSQHLDKIGSVCTLCEVCNVEVNIIPIGFQTERHGANKWLHPSSALVVTGPKTSLNTLIIKDLIQDKVSNENDIPGFQT